MCPASSCLSSPASLCIAPRRSLPSVHTWLIVPPSPRHNAQLGPNASSHASSMDVSNPSSHRLFLHPPAASRKIAAKVWSLLDKRVSSRWTHWHFPDSSEASSCNICNIYSSTDLWKTAVLALCLQTKSTCGGGRWEEQTPGLELTWTWTSVSVPLVTSQSCDILTWARASSHPKIVQTWQSFCFTQRGAFLKLRLRQQRTWASPPFCHTSKSYNSLK